jgi:hypothetical protein
MGQAIWGRVQGIPWASAKRRRHITASGGGGGGGFDPLTLPGLARWGKVSTLALAADDPCSSYTDLSGLGNHATSITTHRPLFKAAVANGKATLRFDGTDDYLTMTNAGGALDMVGGGLMMMVVRVNASTSHNGVLWISDNDHNNEAFILDAAVTPGNHDNPYFTFSSIANGDDVVTDLSVRDGAFRIYELWTDDATMEFCINGVVMKTFTNAYLPDWHMLDPTGDALNYGGWGTHPSNYFALGMDLAEDLVCTHAGGVDSTNRTAARNYLASEYGITL